MNTTMHDAPQAHEHHASKQSRSLLDGAIIRQAAGLGGQARPRLMARNPVMMVVEVGSVLTTIVWLRDLGSSSGSQNLFAGLVAAWLWFTVLFANFAEAMAEGRGKAQADTLRKARSDTIAHVRRNGGSSRSRAPAPARRRVRRVGRRDDPWDGEIIEGIASVDESAITGESAPVIRESGGDRSAVTGGTRVLSDQIVVRITARPGETFLDRMIALVEGASRQKTPNEIALNILLSGLTLIFLLATVTLQPFAIYSGAEQELIVLVALLVCLIPTTIGALLSAIGIAGMDRLVQRTCWRCPAGPWRQPVTAPRCCSTRPAPSPSATARPPRSARRGVTAAELAEAAHSRASPTRPRKADRSWYWPGTLRPARASSRRRARALHRPDPDVRRRHRRPLHPQGRHRLGEPLRGRDRWDILARPRTDRHRDGHQRGHAARWWPRGAEASG